MIARVSGTILAVRDGVAEIAVGDLAFELYVAAFIAQSLSSRVGQSATFHTTLQFEGNVAAGNLIPRMYGFTTADERDFAELLTRIRGVSLRKALRIIAQPIEHIAAAIVRKDERYLTALPEVGKKTATQFVTELADDAVAFIGKGEPAQRVERSPINDAQRTAVQIIVGWGDRPTDAERWVIQAVSEDPKLSEPDQIVTAAYRVRARQV